MTPKNMTHAGTDFSTWKRSNLERLAAELTAEVIRLRSILCVHCAAGNTPNSKGVHLDTATMGLAGCKARETG